MEEAVKLAFTLEPQKLKTTAKWKEQDANEFIHTMALTCDIWFENHHYRTTTNKETLVYGGFSLRNAFQNHTDSPAVALHQMDAKM